MLGRLGTTRENGDMSENPSQPSSDVWPAGAPVVGQRAEIARLVKPEYIERSVHEDLTKVGFYRENAEDAYTMYPMAYEQLVKLASGYNADGHISGDAPKKVEILDLMDKTASVKLTAEWGVDYMHLAKYDGTWKIIHVLWQSHPMK